MKVKLILIFLLFGLSIFSISCKKNADEIQPQYEKGVFITNEGTFTQDNGSISYYSSEDDIVINELFYNQNQRYPGDIVHSLSIFNNRVYTCIRGSGKIEVTDINFKWIATIDNLEGVRYLVAANESKAYASSWDRTSIAIIDIKNNIISGEINIGYTGLDKMFINDTLLFVAHNGGAGGGDGIDNSISVIDIASDATEKVIYLPANKPIDMLKDLNNNLWVLCKGRDVTNGGSTPAALIKINLETIEVLSSTELFADQHPTHLAISLNGQTLYYGAGLDFTGIYKIDVTELVTPTEPFITKKFYGFEVDPYTGNILCLEVPNFTRSGKLHIYNSDGTFVKNFNVGIGPGNVCF